MAKKRTKAQQRRGTNTLLRSIRNAARHLRWLDPRLVKRGLYEPDEPKAIRVLPFVARELDRVVKTLERRIKNAA